MDWHHLIYNTYVCLLQPFPLVQLSALRLVDISCCLAPDDVSATEHSASPVLLRGTACHPTFELHQHYQLLKPVSRFTCFCSHALCSLIRVAYSVQRPCSDFTDMLWRLTNCCIIIIIIIKYIVIVITTVIIIDWGSSSSSSLASRKSIL